MDKKPTPKTYYEDTDIIYNNKIVGLIRSITITNQKNIIHGNFNFAMFDKEKVLDIFPGEVHTQWTPFDIIINNKEMKIKIKNVWITDITGYIYVSNQHIVISNYEPSSPELKDGKTYFVAEEIQITKSITSTKAKLWLRLVNTRLVYLGISRLKTIVLDR